jgi:hypothetical protein
MPFVEVTLAAAAKSNDKRNSTGTGLLHLVAESWGREFKDDVTVLVVAVSWQS